MIYGLIRYGLGLTIFIVFFVLIKRSNIIKKNRMYIISFIAISLLTTLLYFIPIENLFISFSSPEKAFKYINTWKIDSIVNGSETDFVIASKDEKETYRILPKTGDGWKISTGLDMKPVLKKLDYKAVIQVYRYRDTNDFYIVILDFDGIYNITDNRKSDFYCVPILNDILKRTSYHYYACIHDINDGYVISLNGEDIKISVP